MLSFLVGPTALEKRQRQKEKLSLLMRQYIRQSKLSTTKAVEAKNEPIPKQAKILLYMEQKCHAPIGCFTTT